MIAEPTTTNKKKPRRTGPTVWEVFFLADVVSSPLFLLACFLLEAFLLRLGKTGSKTRLFKKSYKKEANKSEVLIKVEAKEEHDHEELTTPAVDPMVGGV